MPNGDLPSTALDDHHGFTPALLGLLETRARQMNLSLRRVHRSARVARTIADLEGALVVEPRHLDEALGHRPKAVAP